MRTVLDYTSAVPPGYVCAAVVWALVVLAQTLVPVVVLFPLSGVFLAMLPALATVWENVCVLLYAQWIAHDAFVYTRSQIMGTLNIWPK